MVCFSRPNKQKSFSVSLYVIKKHTNFISFVVVLKRLVSCLLIFFLKCSTQLKQSHLDRIKSPELQKYITCDISTNTYYYDTLFPAGAVYCLLIMHLFSSRKIQTILLFLILYLCIWFFSRLTSFFFWAMIKWNGKLEEKDQRGVLKSSIWIH